MNTYTLRRKNVQAVQLTPFNFRKISRECSGLVETVVYEKPNFLAKVKLTVPNVFGNRVANLKFKGYPGNELGLVAKFKEEQDELWKDLKALYSMDGERRFRGSDGFADQLHNAMKIYMGVIKNHCDDNSPDRRIDMGAVVREPQSALDFVDFSIESTLFKHPYPLAWKHYNVSADQFAVREDYADAVRSEFRKIGRLVLQGMLIVGSADWIILDSDNRWSVMTDAEFQETYDLPETIS